MKTAYFRDKGFYLDNGAVSAATWGVSREVSETTDKVRFHFRRHTPAHALRLKQCLISPLIPLSRGSFVDARNRHHLAACGHTFSTGRHYAEAGESQELPQARG